MKVGDRIRLKRDVDRFPYFVAKAGLTGTIVEISGKQVSVEMHEIIPNCNLWDNCILWWDVDLAGWTDDVEIIRQKSARELLQEAADETGWNEDSQILVLCDFIDKKPKESFERYLTLRVDEELDMEERFTIDELEEFAKIKSVFL